MKFEWARDAKYWRRLWSVQFLIIGMAFTGLTSVVPMLFGASPFAVNHPYAFCVVVMVLNIGTLATRLVDQPSVPIE